jgi:hypothetical protein
MTPDELRLIAAAFGFVVFMLLCIAASHAGA